MRLGEQAARRAKTIAVILALTGGPGAPLLRAQTAPDAPAAGAAAPPSTPPAASPSLPDAPTADQVKKALQSRRDELDTTLSKAGVIEKDVAALNAEREKINSRLLETAALIQKSESRLTDIEGRLSELEAQEKMVRGSLSQRHDQIAKLLAALQRMGRNPPPVIVTKREDALEMVRSAMLLAAAFPGMRTQALELADTLSSLMRVMGDIRSEADKLKAETTRLSDLRTRLAGLMETKRQSISERQAELQKVREAASDISKSVNDLNELISKLDQAVAQNTGLNAYEAEAKAAVAAAPPEAAASSAPVSSSPTPAASVAAAGASTPDTKVVELAPTASPLMSGNAGRIKPAIPFHLAKAKLPLPVSGRRVLTFGERTQYGSNSKGVVLETRSAAQVTSPCDGWIVYAGEFRSYGKLLIINAGGGYHVLLAGLSQIDVQPGQFVLAAEPVGTMSSMKKDSADVPNSAPVLYIEFRKDGDPIDPDPWWAAVSQKAQG